MSRFESCAASAQPTIAALPDRPSARVSASRGEGYEPVGIVLECEVSDGISSIASARDGVIAYALVRVFGEPIAMLNLTLDSGGLSAEALARRIVDETGDQLSIRLREAGLEWTGQLPVDGFQPRTKPAFIASREAVLRDGPEVTVAICTRDRTDDLSRLLVSIREQTYERLKVLVVDNAPSDNRTAALVAALDDDLDVAYVLERRPGLSWARNRAIDASTTEIIAWADDDETLDPWWAAEVARGYHEVPEAEAVTGLVLPAELDTPYQMWFERYSGVQRGRGFQRAVISPSTSAAQSPLYPLPPFGAGANMSFRRSAIERIGRFDTALGTGTATLAGEDTAAMTSLLLAGGTIVYQPTALVHHRHRRDRAALERVMLGYGRGLSAYYASTLWHHPRCLPELLRLSRQAVRDQVSASGRRLSDLDGFPPDLLRTNRKGLLQGAFMYPGARWRARRLAGSGGDTEVSA